MISPQDLVKAFERNTRIIEMQSAGLSNADSLIQTDYNINCLNWTLGHLVRYRNDLIDFLGGEPAVPVADLERYARESNPVTGDGPDVRSLDELVAMARASQDRIAEVVGSMSDDDFAAERTVGERTFTVGSRSHFTYFHDTYHVGQTELLRQIAGAGDSVI